MAGAPPRRESLSSATSIIYPKPRSSLETLLTMGFSRKRAVKAIAATGDKGVTVASEWLMSHVNDPSIDQENPREYILYLCPTGDFLTQLNQYWETSKTLGWNAAHIYHPHITLCPFFSMADNKVWVINNIVSMISTAIQEWNSIRYSVGLQLGTKNKSFIGYFVSESVHNLIEDLMVNVQEEFRKQGVQMKPQSKQLHLTIGFKYKLENHDKLMELATCIKLPPDVKWEVRVYSRDARLRTSEVRRILKDYKPEQGDELELTRYDHIVVDPQEVEKSQDGWYRGSSNLTGSMGFFPGNFTERCSQMDVWTLHRAVDLKSRATHLAQESDNKSNLLSVNGDGGDAAALSDSDYDNLWVNPSSELYATVNKKKGAKIPPQPPQPRKVFIMRHAQRCDFSYKNWFDRSFNEQGFYARFDLNCPPFLLPRQSYKHYSHDGPITEIGKVQALITGEGLRDAGEVVHFIYASPALRCVQTAYEVIKGLNSCASICIEPGLFEWCGWCRNILPSFMTQEELVQAGFPIECSYVPYLRSHQLDLGESIESYYNRSYQTTKHITNRHSAQGGRKILLVGHSGSMDACTRQLRGKPPKSTDVELRDVVRGCPYCFLGAIVEDVNSSSWDFCDPPVPPLTHGGVKEYEWRTLLR